MSKIKINSLIKRFIEKSIHLRHRSMVFLYGKQCTEQVMLLYHMLLTGRQSVDLDPPSVLWCFKKKLFTTFNEKRLKTLRKKYQNSSNAKPTKEDLFDHFIIGAGVQFCHYSESSRILGRTVGLLVLQDFAALTPNLLARSIECVEGGGMVLFLMPDIQSPLHIPTVHMDAHSRLVTDAFPHLTPRFNGRLLRSLSSCPNCIVLDECLNVKFLPDDFMRFLNETQPAKRKRVKVPANHQEAPLLQLCRTRDQARVLLQLLEGAEEGLVCLTAPRGRGKSAVLGLALARATGRVLLSSPHLENLQTVFEFLVKGLCALGLREGTDFRVTKSEEGLTSEVTVSGGRKFQYRPPGECGEADLVVLDEAAAIPLPLVKQWTERSQRLFMASTINGYEGTGRSLSLKLISQLRSQSADNKTRLLELELSEAVRYAEGDGVEQWLEQLLCLHPPPDNHLQMNPPSPQECTLFRVDRDALFGGGSERFLQEAVGLFSASHYKNTPNDLLMAADAPAHSLFCLLPPPPHTQVLCAIQVAFEGGISPENFEFSHGKRASGDMIPWVIAQQFLDPSLAALRGARVVRIATRPDCQRMGYGQRALELLVSSFEDQSFRQKKGTKSLLTRDCGGTPLDYWGVSFGLTHELFRFWKKCGYVPLYVRQSTSEVTGEHTCMMVRGALSQRSRLRALHPDFAGRLVALLPTAFRRLPPALILDLLSLHDNTGDAHPTTRVAGPEVLRWLFHPGAVRRLRFFCDHQGELAAVLDLLPTLASCHLLRTIPHHTPLPSFLQCVLVSVCLQGKGVDVCAAEMNTDPGQVLGAISTSVRKLLSRLKKNVELSEESLKRPPSDGSQNAQRHKKFRPT